MASVSSALPMYVFPSPKKIEKALDTCDKAKAFRMHQYYELFKKIIGEQLGNKKIPLDEALYEQHLTRIIEQMEALTELPPTNKLVTIVRAAIDLQIQICRPGELHSCCVIA
jgi:hypothetical protein